jgi:large subunit ribosomal protein L13
LMAASY